MPAPHKKLAVLCTLLVTATGAVTVLAGAAIAAPAPVDLRTSAAFAVLGGSTVTNTGPTVVDGDLGLSPGTSVTGFPPGVLNGTLHLTDASAAQAQLDATLAYDDAAGRANDATLATLGGRTLAPGVYTGSSLSLVGTLSLDAGGDPDAVFVLRSGSDLVTATSSTVALLNGASACNVFWQVGSSATLGTATTFAGTLVALTSITADTGTTVDGRLLARNGAVTLDSNRVSVPTCAAAVAAPTASGSPSASATVTVSPSPVAEPAAAPVAAPAPSHPSPTSTTMPTSMPTPTPTASSAPAPTPTATPLATTPPTPLPSPTAPASSPAPPRASGPGLPPAPDTAVPVSPVSPVSPVGPVGPSAPPAPAAPAAPAGSPVLVEAAAPGAMLGSGLAPTGDVAAAAPAHDAGVGLLPRTGAGTSAATLTGLSGVLLGTLLLLAGRRPKVGRHARTSPARRAH